VTLKQWRFHCVFLSHGGRPFNLGKSRKNANAKNLIFSLLFSDKARCTC